MIDESEYNQIDRFPYAGMTRFRFTGYDLSLGIATETPPTF
jgi:hypothetical protein